MVVSFLLNTEHFKVEELKKWVLKSASFAMENPCLVVTHEYFKYHMEKILEELEERFYKEFEMRKLSMDDVKNLDICYIPDYIFDEVYMEQGAQSKMLVELEQKRNPKLETYIIDAIDRALRKHNETSVDYMINQVDVFASINAIAEHYNCPIISYLFSAVRMVHGYTQTLYMAHIDNNLFNSDVCKKMYENFNKEQMSFTVLNKKEIMALLGKKRNLCLLPMMDIDGKYEMGIAGEGFSIKPQTYRYDGVIDDDLYYESYRHFDMSEIISRPHPIVLDRIGATRKHMKNDPAQFLLSCKRVSTVQSQTITKAAMWNRVPCVLGNALPYAFLFSHDFTSRETLPDADLNFILFAYFVPGSLMFNREYWLWRFTKPSVNEILERHINEILENLGLDKSVLYSKERLVDLLKKRGLTDIECNNAMSTVLKEDIDYEHLASRIQVEYMTGETKDYYCLNKKKADELISCFDIPKSLPIKCINIYLLDDVDGFVEIRSINVNGKDAGATQHMSYWSKGMCGYKININNLKTENLILEIKWHGKTAEQYFA